MAKTPRLGTGQRFKSLVDKLTNGDVADPKALAASIGKKKLGGAQMASLAKKGKA